MAFLVASGFGSALPQSIPVVNAGFEDNSIGVPYIEFTFGPPAGWVLHDPNLVTNGGAGSTYYLGTLTPFRQVQRVRRAGGREGGEQPVYGDRDDRTARRRPTQRG